MIRQLPYSEWRTAHRELKAIRQRARMVNEPDIDKILTGISQTLVADRLPLVASCELQFLAELVPRYPHLQKCLLGVARQINEYPMAESSPATHFR